MSRIYLCTGPHTISPPVQTGPAPPVPLQTCGKTALHQMEINCCSFKFLFVLITCKLRKWSWRQPHRQEVPSIPVSTTKNATWIQLEYKHMGECKGTSSTLSVTCPLSALQFQGNFSPLSDYILLLAPLSSLLPPSPTWAWDTVCPSFLSLSLTYLSMR